jgi:opacity protein-like surface antigen
MKRYLFVFVALFLSNQIHAQKNIGVMGGTSLSNVRIRNVQELVAPLLPSGYQSKWAFYVGGYADFSLSDLIFLTPELFYANRGYKMVYDPLNTTFRVTNNTIVLPVLLKFNLLKKLQIYTGPELSYVVEQNIKDLTNGTINFESTSDRSFDIAVSAGVSFTLIKKLSIDLRYNFGLNDLKKTYNIPGDFIDPGLAGQQIPVDYATYNWSFQAGFRYSFISKN